MEGRQNLGGDRGGEVKFKKPKAKHMIKAIVIETPEGFRIRIIYSWLVKYPDTVSVIAIKESLVSEQKR